MIPLLVLLGLAGAAPDRSAPPPVAVAAPLPLPAPQVTALPGGATLHHVTVPGVRRVVVQVTLWRGALAVDGRHDPADQLAGELWTTAARGLPAATLDDRAARLDASLEGWVGARSAGVRLDVPRERLDEALDLLAAVLHAPTFPAGEVARARREEADWLTGDALHSGRVLAASAAAAAWYAPDDPRAGVVDPADVRRTRRGALRRIHQALLADAPVEVLVVGDVAPDQVTPALTALVAGVGAPGERPPPLSWSRPACRSLGVHLPGAEQARVVVRYPAPPRHHPDGVAALAAHHALGGHFLSRLNRVLREERGWTYGGYGRLDQQDDVGTWTYEVEVAAEHAAATVAEIRRAVEAVAEEGVADEELATLRSAAAASWNTHLATADDAFSFYDGQLLTWQRTLDDARGDLLALADLQPDEVAAVTARWMVDPLVVVVGDRPTLTSQEAVDPWISAEEAVRGQVACEPPGHR